MACNDSFLVNIAPAWISSKHKDLKKTGQNLLSLLDDFLETCSENRITIIIIDPTVLKSVLDDVNSQKTHHRKGCYHFCQKPIITLGVLESRLNPSGLNARVSIAQFERKKNCLYKCDRKALGLWHGSISWKDFAINLDKKLISYYFHNESVLNRFSLDISTVDGYTIRLPSEIDEFLKNLNTSRYLPCNMKRARQFYSKYGDDGTSKAGTFRKRGKEVLKIAKIILDDLRVRFWLSSGTCLGWFRQCSVISHGKDMDIGMWITDYNKQLIDEFQNNGLYLEHLFGRVNDSFQMSFKTVDDIKLDIFFFYEEETYMWNGGTQAKTGKKFKYIFPNFSLCWTEFLGMKVRVPCQTLSYIEANYGKSWAEPVKHWDWKKSPSNVIENGEWDEKDWPDVIQFFEIQ
ncbi:fukutin-like [Dendronephthya gigantea]|uniref:fukutin-like n=1 Tax=Dendronephthya gigantea TaxID=151771 RepID=UPI00106D37AA|nr:fukutin-like [Dendronephthya gigantea]